MRIVDLVEEYLSSEGFRHEMDNDGDIHFKYQGLNFYCRNHEGDESYFQIIMPNIYDVQGDRVKVLEATNKVTRDTKVLKAFLVQDSLWLSVEMFVDSNPIVGDFFFRCMDILCEGRKQIAREIFGE